jgi:hypothetical protein
MKKKNVLKLYKSVQEQYEELQKQHNIIWDAGFNAGIQIGMYEAIGILMFQAEKHGTDANINDLTKLIRDDIENVAGSYGI